MDWVLTFLVLIGWIGIVRVATRVFWLNPALLLLSVVMVALGIRWGDWFRVLCWAPLIAMFAWDTTHFSRNQRRRTERV